jgi:hypothetical protein
VLRGSGSPSGRSDLLRLARWAKRMDDAEPRALSEGAQSAAPELDVKRSLTRQRRSRNVKICRSTGGYRVPEGNRFEIRIFGDPRVDNDGLSTAACPSLPVKSELYA